MLLMTFSLPVIPGAALAPRLLRRWCPQRAATAELTAIATCDAALDLTAGSDWALPLVVATGGMGVGASSIAATSLGTSV